MSEKTGILIGQALIENPEQPVAKISFKKVCIGETGLLRILEATNCNCNITTLYPGCVSDRGLMMMAKVLRANKGLTKLKFTEHVGEPWSDESKSEFVKMVMGHKNLIKVKFDCQSDDDDSFKHEIDFYVNKIKKSHKQANDIDNRKESCTNEHLFSDLLKMIEDKDDHEKMPVRKFFNNTFDTLINDAIFNLMKRQSKSKNNQIRTMQGSIKFVA